MSRRLGLWLLLCGLLPGCALMGGDKSSGTATEATQSAQSAWEARRAELTALDHWLMQARVASGRLIGGSGNLRWRQSGERFDLRVAGPLGASGFQASGHLGEVEIRTRDGSIVTHDPETWLEEKIGWSVPLQQLRYWAIGIPYPSSPAKLHYDAQGRLESLEQDGWLLHYSEYGFFQQHELPRRFTLENGDRHFRVIVDDWTGMS